MPTDRDFRYDLRPALQPMLLPAWALAAGIAAGPSVGLRAGPWVAACLALSGLALVALRRRTGPSRGAMALCLGAAACLGAARVESARVAAAERPLARLAESGALEAGARVTFD